MVVDVNASQVALEAPIPATRPALGVLGRILLAAVFAAGLVLGYSSGLGLALYIPFAGVGAFLALRRPRMTIGWMLFAVGWSFALISSRVDATVAQFEAGTVELADMAFIVIQDFGYMGAFLLFPTLVLAFPTGRLASGTWGRVVRIGLAVEAILLAAVIFAPRLNVNLVNPELSVVVRNPLSVLPDLPIWAVVSQGNVGFLFVISMVIAATSIGVRFRRAVGVERQQLQWLAVAISFVALGVVSGLTISGLFPRVGDSGIVWVPALAGFVAVPVSIAVAVLRYRLYEINTIINRAIVYGLLTAILTGGSAAIIALGQRLFVGVIGAGSDATIVLTTLLVVTAFNPIKTRLQAVVDRRFKDSHGPDAALEAFVLEVRQSLSPPDLHRSLARLLETAVVAHRSSGGYVAATVARRKPWTFATGEAGTGPGMVAVASAGSVDVRLEIAQTDELATADALQAALEAIVAEATGSDTGPRALATR
jgi:hypothetical protein